MPDIPGTAMLEQRVSVLQCSKYVKHPLKHKFRVNPVNTDGYVTRLIRQSAINTPFMDIIRAKMDINRLKMDINRVKMDINRAKMDINRAKMDINRAKMDINRVFMDINRAKMDISRAFMDISKPFMDINRAKMPINGLIFGEIPVMIDGKMFG